MAFETIGIIGKYGRTETLWPLPQLIRYLQQQGRELLLDKNTADRLPDHGVDGVELHTLGLRCNLVIVVGGDGTLLNAARSLAQYDVPLLGINLGRLGFLVDVLPMEMTRALDEVLDGHYRQEERFLIRCEHFRQGEDEPAAAAIEAFNDIVLHKTDATRMIEFDTFADGTFISNHRADGFIISTPTGSTAYALSGGGPVMHPSLNALVMLPICPHTLSDRPIVLDANTRINVLIKNTPRSAEVHVACDGQTIIPVQPGDQIQITKATHGVTLIHPADYDYFMILRNKLHWGSGRSAEPPA